MTKSYKDLFTKYFLFCCQFEKKLPRFNRLSLKYNFFFPEYLPKYLLNYNHQIKKNIEYFSFQLIAKEVSTSLNLDYVENIFTFKVY